MDPDEQGADNAAAELINPSAEPVHGDRAKSRLGPIVWKLTVQSS